MIETHTRFLVIAPYEGMKTVIERAAQSYPNIQIDIEIGDLAEGQEIARQVQANAASHYDCIISRGGTAELIRKAAELPVVDIRTSVYDILRAIKLAENYSSLYAIVGFPSITEPAHTLCDLLDYNLDILTVHNEEEVHRTLERLKQGGYRMVVCDMITHRVARQMGFDAFLITSGIESIHMAVEQAMDIRRWFHRLRQENLYLRSISQAQNARFVIMDQGGAPVFCRPTEPSGEFADILRGHIREIPARGSTRFYFTLQNQLYSITAQILSADGVRYNLFYCTVSHLPLHTSMDGIRSLNRGECEHLFSNSFYSISGAMGSISKEVEALAISRQPVMIGGELGTGKEQIARYLYLHSSLVNNPLVVVNCQQMNDKSWDFLLDSTASPLDATGNTVYFQHFEKTPEPRAEELLAAIQETGLARRVRLLFSCTMQDDEPVPDLMRKFSTQLGCQRLYLPTLRSRADEIPSLASLYLNSLNIELGKQISGFEPRAIELLRQYDWPNNYTQFKNVLQTLAALTNAAYIRGSIVLELLSKERSVRRTAAPAASGSLDANRTLEEIIRDAVRQAVDANGGNRAAAARQLGIGRTTLWRYLGRAEDRAT